MSRAYDDEKRSCCFFAAGCTTAGMIRDFVVSGERNEEKGRRERG